MGDNYLCIYQDKTKNVDPWGVLSLGQFVDQHTISNISVRATCVISSENFGLVLLLEVVVNVSKLSRFYIILSCFVHGLS